MSARQFYITLAICVITMKMQKLPCLVVGEVGKDAWLMFLIYSCINILGILFVFLIIKHVNLKNVLKSSKSAVFNIFKFVLMVATTLYFLSQALLMYEHIHDLFANTLFDNLSWSFFSLFLLFAVFFLAHRGLENTALNFELYTWIIVVPLVLLSLLGTSKSEFSVILPFETINFRNIFQSMKQFSCWFGDFFLVLYLAVKAKNIKLSKTLLVYLISMLFMTFLVVVFVGIYDKVAPIEPGLISVISEQSLLDLSLGRIDWFLILFTEIGAILACSTNLYFANLCLHVSLPKIRPIYVKIFNALVLYVLDVFVLVDLNEKIHFFCGVMSDISIVIIAVTCLFLLLLMFCGRFRNGKGEGIVETHYSKNKELQKARGSRAVKEVAK